MNSKNNKTKKNEDDLFSLSFELKTLSKAVNENKLERWVPGFSLKYTEEEHYNRYNWASKFVNRKKVLDIACGSGKGSLILSQKGKASQVTGCDIDEEVIRYASIKYSCPKVKYFTHNAEDFTIKQKFDVIISFETIEHIKNVDKFLKSMLSILREDGIFIVSTPISSKTIDSHPDNEYHVREWGFEEFQLLISRYFQISKIYLQLIPNPTPHIKTFKGYIKRALHAPNIHLQTDHLQVIPWSKQSIASKKLGITIPAYQILQCTRKK